MPSPSSEGSSSRHLFADAADFLTDAGRAINADFLADEEVVVRRLAPAAKSGIDAFLRQ